MLRASLSQCDVHKKYQKLSPREHILLRPEMYIGAVVSEDVPTWIESAAGAITRSTVQFSQGMMKIIDEILVNASDNVLEHGGSRHPVTYVHIRADVSTGEFVIENDGPGIPVVKHKEHGLYIPEMVFGHLLTGKNFGDETGDNNVSAGRHGYGAKLTNIFSTRFQVVTRADGKQFSMTWSNNMADASAAEVKDDSGPDFTRVAFTPDYQKVGMSGLSRAFASALRKRCSDLAVCLPDVEFKFNDKTLTSNFGKYINMYGPTSSVVVASSKHKRDQVLGVAYFESPGGSFKGSHVSMINGVVTYQGGTHLEHAKSLVETAGQEVARKLSGDAKEFNKSKFFSHFIVFTSMYVSQPKFDSQSKVRLVSTHPWATFDMATLTAFLEKIPNFGDKFLSSVFKSNTKPRRSSVDVRNAVQKAHDAVLAGKGKENCTLLITEGDSAAALAVGSLSVEQRRVFGVFPVRGKVMNVLTDLRRVADNKEWTDLFTVMGLDPKRPDVMPDGLRYQRIVFMTDQDHDGTHIRGLLLSGLYRLFPQLAATPGFSNIFVTPMVKAFPTKGDEIWFETTSAFEEWKKLNASTGVKRPARYYKGLGTSTTDEGKVYFSKLHELIRPIIFSDPGSKALVNSFSPETVDHRKSWLAAGRIQSGDFDSPLEPFPTALKKAGVFEGFRETPKSIIPLQGFVDVDLLQFALYDNSRMVPSMVDGLKSSGRKIIDGAMQYQKHSMRVSQLAGLIAQKMAYHHGEVSLVGTIIGFAQDYVTANNVPLLTPEGQFGSRLVPGGKDHAAARYIFTQLRAIAWEMFPKADLHLLPRVTEDGDLVEPVHFAPVIPMIFVNGSMGITVGHKVEIHARHPIDLIAAQRKLISAKGNVDATDIDHTTVKRFITGFLGTIEEHPTESRLVVYHGAYEVVPNANAQIVHLRVVELPQNTSAEKYRGQLATLQEGGHISGYFDYSTTEAVDFDVVVSKERYDAMRASPTGVHGALKLSKSGVENIIGFAADGRLRDSATVKDVFREHYKVRHGMYEKRLEEQRKVKKTEMQIATGTWMFVNLIHRGAISTDVLVDQDKLSKVLKSNDVPVVDGTYGYITRMSISRVFKTEADALAKTAKNAKDAYDVLMATKPEAVWLNELDTLEKAIAGHLKSARETVVAKLEKRRKLGTLVPPSLGVNWKASADAETPSPLPPTPSGDTPSTPSTPPASGGGAGRGRGRGRPAGRGKSAVGHSDAIVAMCAVPRLPLLLRPTAVSWTPIASQRQPLTLLAQRGAARPIFTPHRVMTTAARILLS